MARLLLFLAAHTEMDGLDVNRNPKAIPTFSLKTQTQRPSIVFVIATLDNPVTRVSCGAWEALSDLAHLFMFIAVATPITRDNVSQES